MSIRPVNVQSWGERWDVIVAEHAQAVGDETPREALARRHQDFLVRAPIREVMERFLEERDTWEQSVVRVLLSCGHTQFDTRLLRIRCSWCWLALGPAGQQGFEF